jgi:predicted transcriptional regulator of viral defense system
MNKDYGGPTQNEVYEHFVHDQVYQAVMRFVRGDSPATVYVTTEAIEKWIEPDGVKYYIPNSQPTKDQVATILKKRSPLTTSEVTESVDVSQDRVRQILRELEKEDRVELIQPGRGPRPAMWGRDTSSNGSKE